MLSVPSSSVQQVNIVFCVEIDQCLWVQIPVEEGNGVSAVPNQFPGWGVVIVGNVF